MEDGNPRKPVSPQEFARFATTRQQSVKGEKAVSMLKLSVCVRIKGGQNSSESEYNQSCFVKTEMLEISYLFCLFKMLDFTKGKEKKTLDYKIYFLKKAALRA